MSDFEEYIKARYPVDYESLKEEYPNVPVCEFYGDEQYLWDLKQAKIDDLEKQLNMMKHINDEQSNNMQNAFKTIEIEQRFKDEMQNRINDALNKLCDLQYSSGERIHKEVSIILRGDHD